MFSTGFDGHASVGSSQGLLNNKLAFSPGSEHSGGANFGMGDGSVRYMTATGDKDVFCLLGSMADKEPVQVDQ